MFCEKCGKEISDSAVFCRHCGAKMEEIASHKSDRDTLSYISNTINSKTMGCKDLINKYRKQIYITAAAFAAVLLIVMTVILSVSCGSTDTEETPGDAGPVWEGGMGGFEMSSCDLSGTDMSSSDMPAVEFSEVTASTTKKTTKKTESRTTKKQDSSDKKTTEASKKTTTTTETSAR